MTPEELIKLCGEAEKHNTGSVGRQKRIKAGIAALETAGFSSPARARSYAALWAALDDPATCGNWRTNGRTCLEVSKLNQNWNGLCPRCEALATTEEES